MGAISGMRECMNEGTGKWVSIIVAVGLIAVAGFGIYRYATHSEAESVIAEGHKMWIVCEACGHSERARLPLDQQFPMDCPKCGEPKAVGGQKCVRCEEVFARPPASVYQCPKCKAEYRAFRSGAGGDPEP